MTNTASHTAGWESQIETLMEKSTEKLKTLTKEKSELQNKVYKLGQVLQQEEKVKDSIRERVRQVQEEINRQLKAKFDNETEILRHTEEMAKLDDDLKKMHEKLQSTDANYSNEVVTASTTNDRNGESRQHDTEKDGAGLAAVQQEREMLTKVHEQLCQEFQALQVSCCRRDYG